MQFSIYRFNPDEDKKPYMQAYEIALLPTDAMPQWTGVHHPGQGLKGAGRAAALAELSGHP
jgi:hypothetical protein